jgi:hypothetical protein
VLTDLAGAINTAMNATVRVAGGGAPPPAACGNWAAVAPVFRDWTDDPERRRALRDQLRALPPDEAAAVVARSKEATTHFAWCLYDEPDDPFSLWLHEYKPHRDWLPGYANSVHNHRYHFCTVLLSGGYLHERFTAEVDAAGTAVRSVIKRESTFCAEGARAYLLSDEFHRIPRADDGTMTFLVKSRPVAPWSLSFDPGRGLSRRHLPMSTRLTDLAEKI